MLTGVICGRRPISPATAAFRSDVIAPSQSPLAEILNDVETFGNSASTEARVNGTSVGPTDRNRCPKAYTRFPSI